MWTSDRTLTAKVQPRPVRIAYLIPESAPDELLDSIVCESLSRWGGRRTPFIPTNGMGISEPYWTFLDHWDADIIYSYCDLSDELLERLFFSFAPSEIILHSEVSSLHSFRPIFNGNYQFLSSLSLLPILDRTSHSIDAVLPAIVDNDAWNTEVRDLTDSFGVLSQSCVGAMVHPHARRLSIKRDGACRQGHDSEADYFESVDAWITEVTRRSSVVTLTFLADLLSPSLKYWSDYKHSWDEHLTIVIGDTSNDRLLTWNGQHRYSASNSFNLPILRLSPRRFDNGVPEWLVQWLLRRNHRCLGSTNTKQVKLKSCSLTKEELLIIEQQLKTEYMFLSSEHFAEPNVFDLQDLNTESTPWHYPSARSETIRFDGNKFEVSLCQPAHIQPNKSQQNSNGMWAVELTIDRAEDHSRFDGRFHTWTFPRRLRMETAVSIESYAVDTVQRFGHVVPPYLRPSKKGNLTLWDSASWTRPMISLPTDYGAFCKSLREVPFNHPKMKRQSAATENPFFHWRVNRVSISDKGRDLLGILQFFRSLPEALSFLSNAFWLRLIEDMLPEQVENKRKYLLEISKLIKQFQQGESSSSPIRIAKRALELASRSLNSRPMKILDFGAIYQAATECMKEEKYSGNELKDDVVSSVTYLRNREFLWQGFYWKCTVCEHENWISLEKLTARCFCQICRTPKSSPVTGSSHFRLNPFVQHAFASTSAQGPVIWCLNRLMQQAEIPMGNQNSFAFAPALNIYKTDELKPWTDIDIIANVNGLIVMTEVKRSFSGVNSKVIDQLFTLGEMFRPNTVLLAIQASLPDDQGMLESLKDLRKRLKLLDVDFELWTTSDRNNWTFDNVGIPLPFTKAMNWSGW